MNTCGFKREQVICSDNVWLSEVMLWKRCSARVSWHTPVNSGIPNAISYGHWRPVLPHSNPRAYTRFSQESHRKSKRITRDFHKNHTKNPSVLTRISQVQTTETAAITSVFHAKTLEYVCHTGRTHGPPENSCNPNETKGLSHVYRQVTYVIHM